MTWFLFVNRKGAKDAKGFFVGFVLILEERFRIRTDQALSGGKTKLRKPWWRWFENKFSTDWVLGAGCWYSSAPWFTAYSRL